MADQDFQSQMLQFMKQSQVAAEAAQKSISEKFDELTAANLDQSLRLSQVIVAAEVARTEDREQLKVRFEVMESMIAASPRSSIRGSPHGSIRSSRSRSSLDLSSLRQPILSDEVSSEDQAMPQMSDETSSSPRPKAPAPVEHESGKYSPTVIVPVSSVQAVLIPDVVKVEPSASLTRISSDTLRPSKRESFNFAMDGAPTPFQQENVTMRRASHRPSLGAKPITILPPPQPPNVSSTPMPLQQSRQPTVIAPPPPPPPPPYRQPTVTQDPDKPPPEPTKIKIHTLLTERTIKPGDMMHKLVPLEVKRVLDNNKHFNAQFPFHTKMLWDFIKKEDLMLLFDHERSLNTELAHLFSDWSDVFLYGNDVLLMMIRRKLRPENMEEYETIIFTCCARELRENFMLVQGYSKECFFTVNQILDDVVAYDKLLVEGASPTELALQPGLTFLTVATKTKYVTLLTCFGVDNCKALVHKITVECLKTLTTLDQLIVIVRDINVSLNKQSKALLLSDQSSLPPKLSSTIFQSVVSQKKQEKLLSGRSENRNSLATASTASAFTGRRSDSSGPLLSERRANFERSSQQDAHRSHYLNAHPDDHDLAAMCAIDEEMSAAYHASDRNDWLTDQEVFYLNEAKRQPVRSTPFKPKTPTASDHSQQPCFDTLAGRPCLRDQKKPTPCPYNHDKEFLTKFQGEKLLQANASPYLPRHMHNPNLDKPKPQLRLAEEAQAPTESTDVPFTHTSMLKPSLSARRELSLSDGRFSNRFGEEYDDSNQD